MAVVTQAAPAGHEEDKELLISGSEAVAEALTLADLDVVTAYPIRPYDTVMQAIAKKISGGQLVAEYIVAEGEHSQFEIVKHASTRRPSARGSSAARPGSAGCTPWNASS